MHTDVFEVGMGQGEAGGVNGAILTSPSRVSLDKISWTVDILREGWKKVRRLQVNLLEQRGTEAESTLYL